MIAYFDNKKVTKLIHKYLTMIQNTMYIQIYKKGAKGWTQQ